MNRLSKSRQIGNKHYALGIGFSRSKRAGNVVATVKEIMNQNKIAKLRTIATIVSLGNELFLKELAQALSAQIRLFTAEELEKETPKLTNPSEYIYSLVGCHGVCEAAALAAIGSDATLLVTKIRNPPYTFAIAVSEGNQ